MKIADAPPPAHAAGSLHGGSTSSGGGNSSFPTGNSPSGSTATAWEEEPAVHKLGFPFTPTADSANGVSPNHSEPRQPHAAAAMTQRDAPSSLLGFQPPPSQNGGFPKISSNFDFAGNKDRVQEQISQHQQRSPEQVTQPPPRKNANVSADTSRGLKLTFAEAAARRAARPPDLFVHNLQAIKPVKMNEEIAVFMPSDMYEVRVNSFQFALIGRLTLPQGSAPRGGEDLKRELMSRFDTASNWTLMPLGKGYFSLKFNTVEDKIKASRMTSWKLSIGSLQIREWKPNFNPYKELSSTAQIWVRLFHLPVEYWHPEFLVGIFRAVGNVIKLDGNTAQGLVGHFARALVEIDLNQPLINTIRVGLPDNLLEVDFSYENIPVLCSFCNFVGHSADRCRKAKAKNSKEEFQKQQVVNKDHASQRWVEKTPSGNTKNKQQEKVTTHNQFEAIAADGDPETDMVSSDHDSGKGNGNDSFAAESPTHDHPDNILNSTDEEEETIGETQYQSPANFLDSITVPVDSNMTRPAASKAANRRLIEKVRQTARRRQLRSELKAKTAAATVQEDLQQHKQDAAEETAQPSSQSEETRLIAAAKFDDAAAEQPEDASHTDSVTGGEATAATTSDQNALPPHVPLENTHGMTTTNMEEPPAQTKYVAKRAKNKRKTIEVLPKRQLRSSMKNRSNSEITPEMIQAYAQNQCQSFQVPADSIGQSKAVQVAPNSPHPNKTQLDDKLRTAVELGRHPTAFVIDTGQTKALKAMDLIAKQQWDDIPNTEVYTASDSE